jgi:carbon-monoxide dehydrogenase medium subunit
MNICKNYYIPTSISEALKALGDPSGGAAIIAGGTDLLLDIQQGRQEPADKLIDISELPELTALEVRGDKLFIGASVTHQNIKASPLVAKHCSALKVASGLIGGPQVRNTATIGGNVAHALPAADCIIALLALDARVEIATLNQTRIIPIAELFLGPGRSILENKKEILIGFYVQLKGIGQASTFQRIMRPQGVAIAIINIAVWMQRNGGVVEDVRIAVGPSGPIPRRMFRTEKLLREQQLTQENVHQAYQELLKESQFRTSPYRASADYRKKMAGVLLTDTLYETFELCQS